MPIYAYQCQSCGHELEALQKMSDPLLTECPACHQASLQKQVSAVAFRLGGSGWYETDFKKDGKKNLKENASGTDTTPAPTTTPAPACGTGACPACS